MKDQPLLLRGVLVNPLADVALPLLLTLQTALAVGMVTVLLDGLAGRPFLPGLGWWALLVAAESVLFTSYFFVREWDLPWVLRGVEAVLMLLLAKWAATAPLAGWGLSALLHVGALDPWVGVVLLTWAWVTGMGAAHLCGALHPALTPDPTIETIKRNDHGEAFERLRSRVLGLTGGVALLAGLLPVLAGPGVWTAPAGGRWLGPGLIALAVTAAASLFVAARLRQEINWKLERVTPPEGVLRRWAAQAMALMLLPLILAALLPAGPRLPVERLAGREEVGERLNFSPPMAPPSGKGEWLAPELLEQVVGRSFAFPAWLRDALVALLAFAAVMLAGLALQIAYRQLAERMGWSGGSGLLPLLRALLRWYGALWQALVEAVRGAGSMAARSASQAGAALFGQAGLLGRYLPAWGRPPGEPRAAVRYYFARLQADAARRGLGRPAGETAAEFGARLSKAAPDQAEEVAALGRAYEQARYSQEAVSLEQVSLVRRAWVQVVRALRRR